MLRKIERWLEQLVDVTPHKLVLRAGDQRQSLSIIGRYEIIIDDGMIIAPTIEELEDCLSMSGYGDEKQFARIIAYDEKGRQIKSLSLKQEKAHDDQASLVDGILAMAGEMRRFVATINHTLEAREETLTHIIDQLMVSRHAEIESNAAALALDMELQQAEQNHGSDHKERALGLAESVVSQMVGASQLTPESIKSLLMSSPEIIDNLLEDDDIVNIVGAKFMSRGQ